MSNSDDSPKKSDTRVHWTEALKLKLAESEQKAEALKLRLAEAESQIEELKLKLSEAPEAPDEDPLWVWFPHHNDARKGIVSQRSVGYFFTEEADAKAACEFRGDVLKVHAR